MKLINQITLLLLGLAASAISFANAEEENTFATEEESFLRGKKALKTRRRPGQLRSTPDGLHKNKYFNDTMTNRTYRDMNASHVKQGLDAFHPHRFDYKLYDQQLHDVFDSMRQNDVPFKTLFGDRAYMEIFLQNFKTCDQNRDEVLDLAEFKFCVRNDTYLAQIMPPHLNQHYASHLNHTNYDMFYKILFTLMDVHNHDFLNFYDYMELRLLIFSWRKCTVVAPFINEVSFECALDVAAKLKKFERSTWRNTYKLALEQSNSLAIRNIDFLNYVRFAQSARLYSKINAKGDTDVNSKTF